MSPATCGAPVAPVELAPTSGKHKGDDLPIHRAPTSRGRSSIYLPRLGLPYSHAPMYDVQTDQQRIVNMDIYSSVLDIL